MIEVIILAACFLAAHLLTKRESKKGGAVIIQLRGYTAAVKNQNVAKERMR